MITVYNKIGTSNENPPSGYNTWKEYWEDKKRRKFQKCSNLACNNDAEVGAHVYPNYSHDTIYIVPLCKECNYIYNQSPMNVEQIDLLRLNQ